MKASDLLVKALENEGVKYVFGIPGEENLDFLDSLRKSNIQLILTRHEQAAGFMAATYGRLTGKAGVALSTLGPGATNFVTSAAYATLGGMPMMMITGQKPIHTSKQGRFQIIDIVDMMRPLTKFTKQITHPNTIPSNVREAFRLAECERPGAVHLELPEDVASENADRKPFEITQVRRPAPDTKTITQAIEMIEKAKSPLVLVGAGANRKRVSKALLCLLENTGIPYFNTQMGKGVVPEDHDLYVGTAALSSTDYIHCAIDRADLIINIGHDVIEKPPFLMNGEDRRKVIHINFSPSNIDDIYFPQLEIVGDIADSLGNICSQIKRQKHWKFDYFFQMRDFLKKHIAEQSNQESFPLTPQRVVGQVQNAMRKGDIVSLDNGMYKIWFARNYITHESNTLLLDNALATMGAGLPSAIAAKLVSPQKNVLAVLGDGGFMMNSQELETAVRLKQDLVVVILNDSGYGMIKWKQDSMDLPSFGLDFQNPDFVQYAQSYGATGHRLQKGQLLSDLITKAFDQGGVHVIDVPVDYSQNHVELTQKLVKKSCKL